MPDAFDQLRDALVRQLPDQEFAARLRQRLARALELPEGVTVSQLTESPAPGTAQQSFRHGDIGYVSLQVPDVERAAAFFAAVLHWQYEPDRGSGSRQVAGQALHHGIWGPVRPPTLMCCYAVADAAAAAERVRALGGTAAEPHPEPYGLIVDCTDDQGVVFALFEPPGGVVTGAAASSGSRQGDVAYLTMEVPDSASTREFYGALLGWACTPGGSPDGWQVHGVVPMVGISGGHDVAVTVPMYQVDDITAAVAAVRAAGGTAADPESHPYGITSACTDDQGTRFYLGQLNP